MGEYATSYQESSHTYHTITVPPLKGDILKLLCWFSFEEILTKFFEQKLPLLQSFVQTKYIWLYKVIRKQVLLSSFNNFVGTYIMKAKICVDKTSVNKFN